METQTLVKNSQVKTRQDEITTQKVFTRRFYRSFSGVETLQKSPPNGKGQASSNLEANKVVEKQPKKVNKQPENKKFDEVKAEILKNERDMKPKDEPTGNQKLVDSLLEQTVVGSVRKDTMVNAVRKDTVASSVRKETVAGSVRKADEPQNASSDALNRSVPKDNHDSLSFESIHLKDLKQLEKFAHLLELAKSQADLKPEELEKLENSTVIEDFTKAAKLDEIAKPDKSEVTAIRNAKNEEREVFETPISHKVAVSEDSQPVASAVSMKFTQPEQPKMQSEPARIVAKQSTSTAAEQTIGYVDIPQNDPYVQNNQVAAIFSDSEETQDNTDESLILENSQSLAIQPLENQSVELQDQASEIQQSEVPKDISPEADTLEGSEQLSEQIDIENKDSGKRYSTAQDFGKLSTIFRDRRPQYQAYIFFLIVASVSAVTLAYKFSVAGLGGISRFVTGYLSYAQTLGNGFADTAIFASPFLLTSLLVYFGGYTVFAKVLSALWMLASGFVWGVFASASYSVLNPTQMVFFSVTSAVILFTCVLFAAEAGKYSALNIYGKSELTKPSNIRQFTFVYIVYCASIMLLSVVMLRYIF